MAPHFIVLTKARTVGMSLSKAEVRKAALARRALVTEPARAAFAARLAALGPRIVMDFAPAGKSLVVSLFSAIGSEPDMGPLAKALHAAGVPLSLPATPRNAEPLTFRRWAPGDPTAAGRMAIAEPLETAAAVSPDVMFVPLAAFDRRGHRIGYGAGHYDRTLAALRAEKPLRAIGVAYGVQEELFIAEEPHDEPLDLVVTDRDILICEA